MEWISRLSNSFLFWAAWIIIPLIMEIIPSIGSFLLLLRKQKKHPKAELTYYPEITLMIPVYNSEKTLAACIGSINDSLYPNDRIHVYLINNQTKDNSFSVFCECQNLYPDLIMQWLNAKQGKSRALNMALFNSGGKYIINIDSDGLLEPSALKNLVAKFEAEPKIQCMTGAILIRSETD